MRFLIDCTSFILSFETVINTYPECAVSGVR